MDIKIPQSFQDILNTDERFSSSVNTVIKNAENYFNTDPPEFFPEYTLHGVKHINKILELAKELISEKSLREFTPCAMAVLVLSVILHDIGMFVKKAGVKKILFDGTMKEEWKKYFEEARYYGKYKKIRAFGNDDEIEDIPVDTEKWNGIHIKIIGEFLRKHHHEISRDIITGKFPGETDQDIFGNTAFGIDSTAPSYQRNDFRFLVGKIAESHCINIRETIVSLSGTFSAQTVHNGLVSRKVPVFFIMSILRLADLLDAGEHRASILVKDALGITSLNSQDEWAWNQHIMIESTDFDKEQGLLNIDAAPDSGTEFIKMSEWVKYIQAELDTSWAIITQYYDKNKYSLTIHIVNCRVFDDGYIKNMNNKFVTERANFKASPNLLPMLVSPLYGDNPTYGVRELVQNAVDACNERAHIKNQPAFEGKIDVSVDTEKKTFTIKDNGIGMTKDVILNHYLVIGYSYRISPHYLQNFVENGKPKVPRTGRFGIGVLAMFLIGPSATIKTRNYAEDLGYEFTVKFSPLDVELQQENIEIKRVSCDIGTEITVELSDDSIKFFKNRFINVDDPLLLEWNQWYCFSLPAITYKVDDHELPKIVGIFELEYDGNPVIWNKFNSENFAEYYWTFSEFNGRVGKPLFCNGIAIPSIPDWKDFSRENGLLVELPTISLSDPFNRLDLNLSRNKCHEIPERENLLREVYKYIIAKLLTADFSSQSKIDDNIRDGFEYTGKEKYRGYRKKAAFIIKDKSFSLLSKPFLVHTNPKRIAIFCSEYLDNNLDSLIYPNCECFSFFKFADGDFQEYYYVFENRLPFSFDLTDFTQEVNLPSLYKSNLALRNFYIDKNFLDDEIKEIYIDVKLEGCRETIINSEAYCDTYQANFNTEYEPTEPYKLPDSILSVYDYSIDVKPDNPDNLMLQQIRDYLLAGNKDIWIPFDMKERIKKFPTAFKSLSEKFPEVFDKYKEAIEEIKNKS
ncbi:MAG: ATP-binding protein [Ruminococcus sp.]|jgi:hypothetical protein|nr:ATP-binding protein [Ruminococcus sp.]